MVRHNKWSFSSPWPPPARRWSASATRIQTWQGSQPRHDSTYDHYKYIECDSTLAVVHYVLTQRNNAEDENMNTTEYVYLVSNDGEVDDAYMWDQLSDEQRAVITANPDGDSMNGWDINSSQRIDYVGEE